MVSTGGAASALAVTPPPAVPAATGVPLSLVNVHTWPLEVPHNSDRWVSPAGGVKTVVADDLSVQIDKTQLSSLGTVTVGVVCVVRVTVSFAAAKMLTGLVALVPR